jgi:hypothetical protein
MTDKAQEYSERDLDMARLAGGGLQRNLLWNGGFRGEGIDTIYRPGNEDGNVGDDGRAIEAMCGMWSAYGDAGAGFAVVLRILKLDFPMKNVRWGYGGGFEQRFSATHHTCIPHSICACPFIFLCSFSLKRSPNQG